MRVILNNEYLHSAIINWIKRSEEKRLRTFPICNVWGQRVVVHLKGNHNLFFLPIEVAEIIPYRQAKSYEDVSFLTDLYLKKGWSLRRISKELKCCKATVRKRLVESGIEIKEQAGDHYKVLNNKIQTMRERGLSYQEIADVLNLWKVSTRTGDGKWYPKTVRETERNSQK